MPKKTQGRRPKAEAAKPTKVESAVAMVARLRRSIAIEQVAISIKGVAHRKQHDNLVTLLHVLDAEAKDCPRLSELLGRTEELKARLHDPAHFNPEWEPRHLTREEMLKVLAEDETEIDRWQEGDICLATPEQGLTVPQVQHPAAAAEQVAQANDPRQSELIDKLIRTPDAEEASPELAAFGRKLLVVHEERQAAADRIAYWARFETRTVTDAAIFEDRTRESRARLEEIDRGLASLEELAAPEVYGQLENFLRTLGIGAAATSMDKPVETPVLIRAKREPQPNQVKKNQTGRGKRALSPEQVNEAKSLGAQGKTQQEIAIALGVSVSTIKRRTKTASFWPTDHITRT